MNERRNLKVLIVDDQFGIRVLLKELLQEEGYDTYEAANGEQALAVFAEETPDLVLLDMKIPVVNGMDVLKRIKKKTSTTKVVIMTAYGEPDLIEEAMASGAVAHFPKPFDVNDVLQSVREILSPSG